MIFVNIDIDGCVKPWYVNVSLITDIMYDSEHDKTIIYFLAEEGRRTFPGNHVSEIIEKIKKAVVVVG